MKNIKALAPLALMMQLLACNQNTGVVPETAPGNTPGDLMKLPPIKEWIRLENFVGEITNIYFPVTVGDTLFYETLLVEDGDSTLENSYVTATGETKIILGISCKVIHDAVFDDGILVEDTYDWYAQDVKGNVWYFGEDTKKLQPDGSWDTDGSFEAGIDGAKAGIIMPFDPAKVLGEKFRQEHYPGEAEDYATYLTTNETVTTALGTFSNCLKTEETTPLDPGVISVKWYAPGVGSIKSSTEIGGDEHGELVKIAD